MGEVSLMAKATFILVAAMLATRLVRRAAASTRALILTAAFGGLLALPAMEILLPSRPVEVQLPRVVSSADSDADPMVAAVATESRSISHASEARVPPVTAASSRLARAAMIVRLFWAIGIVIVLIRLGTGLVRLGTLRKAGEPWTDSTAAGILQQSTSRRVHLFLHGALPAPMTCGIVRPAIGLPLEARQWSALDLRQALIHEVEHIRRADWLVHVLARAVTALYWFHPLAWIAARQLNLECEYACDDAVVRAGDRAPYAQQLVSMARRLSEGVSRPALSMAGRHLAKRVNAVLNQERPRTQLRPGTVAVTSIAALLITAAIAPWQPSAAQSRGSVEDVLPIPTSTDKSFADVSIKRGDPARHASGSFDPNTGMFVARSATLLGLISHAYAAVPQLAFTPGEPYEIHDGRIKGGPEWINTDTFDIDARATLPASADDVQTMLRQLLRDSFELSVHVETRQTEAYRLVRAGAVGSFAPGLQPASGDCDDRWNMEGGGPGQIVQRCLTLAAFAASFSLTEPLGRPVIDRTGASGLFNVSLSYAPTAEELATIYELPPSDFPREILERPSIFAAMERQLGLRLEPARGAVHTLAIDSAVRPNQTR